MLLKAGMTPLSILAHGFMLLAVIAASSVCKLFMSFLPVVLWPFVYIVKNVCVFGQ